MGHITNFEHVIELIRRFRIDPFSSPGLVGIFFCKIKFESISCLKIAAVHFIGRTPCVHSIRTFTRL